MRYEITTDTGHVLDFYFSFDNFKKYLNISKINIPSLESLWNMFRGKYCPQLITKYGSLAVKSGLLPDERTRFQKVCDKVSDYLFNRRQEQRQARAHFVGWSFFDWCSGKNITNWREVKEYEKTSGRKFISWKEKEAEQSKSVRLVKERQQEKIKKKLNYIFSEVQKGRKFTKEVKDGKQAMIDSFRG